MWYEWKGSSKSPNSISQNLENLRIQYKSSPNVVRMNCDLTIQNFPNTRKLSIKSSCLWAVVWQSNSCFIPNWSLSGMWTKLGTTYKWDFLKDFWFHEEYNKQKVRAQKKTLSVTIILLRRAHALKWVVQFVLCGFQGFYFWNFYG